jgi:hypothetical protein
MLSTLFTCAYLGGALTLLPSQESYPIVPGASFAINLENYNNMILIGMGERHILTITLPSGDPVTLRVDTDITTVPEFFEVCEKMANVTD